MPHPTTLTSEVTPSLPELFRTAAEKVSAVVSEVRTLEAALEYAADLCSRKEACQLLASGCAEPLSPAAGTLCAAKAAKIMTAPDLDPQAWTTLNRLCTQRGILLAGGSMRNHLSGIDIGLTMAQWGIAETGTLVIDSSRETVRLATMISEIHVAILPLSRIRSDAFELQKELRACMQKASNYLAFITGASRTADIERVLAIGVHGPLELHILLLEDH